MKNKAFTLVELLGVIVLLGILGIVIIPRVGDSITNSKETALVTQEEQIKKAANDFVIDNIELFDNTDTITIKLGVLKQKGYLPINIKNPKTRKNISNESTITIKRIDNTYEITLNLIDMIDVTENIDNNSPILVLNGNYIEYVDVNSTYQEKGATAKSATGETLDDISIQIKLDDEEKSSIDTSQLLTYTVIYSVTDSRGLTTSATRTVIVRDNKAPQIAFQKETNLHVSEVEAFNIEKDLIITDNYDSNPTMTINSTLANIPGNYVITYTVTDSSGNITTERRVINVNNDWSKYYTNVEYIESTGTQYIDTGVIPNNTTAYEMKVSVLTENSTDKIILGSRVDNQRFWVDFDGSAWNNTILVGYGNYTRTLKYSANTIYNISFNLNQNRTVIINNNEFSISTNFDTTNALPLYLFKANYGAGYSGNFKVYSFKIYDDNILIRDFIPVYRNSDKISGLYDLIQNKFYTDVNTGNFEYNKKFEEKYVRLEYIESTGDQIINTEYIPNPNTSIEVDGYASSNKSIYGSGAQDWKITGYTSDVIKMRFWYNNHYFNSDILNNERHVFKQQNNSFYVDNNLIYTFALEDNTYSYPIILFGTSGSYGFNDYGSGRIYSVKIWEENQIIRNMIPCYRKSDHMEGLYDEVNGEFYQIQKIQ